MNVSSGSWGKNGQIMAVDQFPNAFSLPKRLIVCRLYY